MAPLINLKLSRPEIAEELTELGLEAEREVELKSLLGDISREIERLRSITEEYLRYARIPPPMTEEVYLNTLCAELIEFYRPEAERSAVQLILDPDPLPRPALADPNQIRSALLNLIRNACEALEGGAPRKKHMDYCWGGEANQGGRERTLPDCSSY